MGNNSKRPHLVLLLSVKDRYQLAQALANWTAENQKNTVYAFFQQYQVTQFSMWHVKELSMDEAC